MKDPGRGPDRLQPHQPCSESPRNKGAPLWRHVIRNSLLFLAEAYWVSEALRDINVRYFPRGLKHISIFMIMALRLKQEVYTLYTSWSFYISNPPTCYFTASPVMLSTDNDLYIGTEADFSGNDPIIYREPLQTDQYDSLSLNGEPQCGERQLR